ncbi:hypothetical protein IG631_00767 [Alternaria alternata]|nr:hypothetical protein IG631_00767 [Alternaria alternata]
MYSPEWGTYVVDCGEGAVWSSYSAAGISETLECLLWLYKRAHSSYGLRDLPTGDVTSWTRCLSAQQSVQNK